jgi:hypothetical protein
MQAAHLGIDWNQTFAEFAILALGDVTTLVFAQDACSC